MKVNLLIPIEVSEDGKHCGECAQSGRLGYCDIFEENREFDEGVYRVARLPACLKAEVEAKEK